MTRPYYVRVALAALAVMAPALGATLGAIIGVII